MLKRVANAVREFLQSPSTRLATFPDLRTEICRAAGVGVERIRWAACAGHRSSRTLPPDSPPVGAFGSVGNPRPAWGKPAAIRLVPARDAPLRSPAVTGP